MKCIECGHELKDGAVFCIRCGAMQVSMDGKPLERSSSANGEWSQVNPAVPGQHTREFAPAPSGGRRTALVVAVIVVVLAIIGVLAFTLFQPTSSGSGSASNPAAGASASASSDSASSDSTSSDSTSSASTSSSASSASASSSAASASSAAASSAAAATTNNTAQGGTIVNEAPQQTSVATEQSSAPWPSSGDYILSDSSTRYYSEGELQNMSASDLYYARNEIFARHGRMFKRDDLQEYFDSKDWYTRIYTPEQWDSMGNQLNDCEMKNSSLMKKVEESKGSPYL